MIIAIKNKNGENLDHFNVKCQISQAYFASNRFITKDDDIRNLQEELVSTILRLSLLDSQLPKPPLDCTWTLMVVTTDSHTEHSLEIVRAALLGGDWVVDNNEHFEQVLYWNFNF